MDREQKGFDREQGRLDREQKGLKGSRRGWTENLENLNELIWLVCELERFDKQQGEPL